MCVCVCDRCFLQLFLGSAVRYSTVRYMLAARLCFCVSSGPVSPSALCSFRSSPAERSRENRNRVLIFLYFLLILKGGHACPSSSPSYPTVSFLSFPTSRTRHLMSSDPLLSQPPPYCVLFSFSLASGRVEKNVYSNQSHLASPIKHTLINDTYAPIPLRRHSWPAASQRASSCNPHFFTSVPHPRSQIAHLKPS